MSRMYLLRGAVVWAVMMAAESFLGALRMFLLVPMVGELRGRQIGLAVGMAVVLALACLFVRWMGASNGRQLLNIGLTWAALTLLFEVALGRLVMGLSWGRITDDYNPARGALMGFGLAFMALCPLIAAKLRRPGVRVHT